MASVLNEMVGLDSRIAIILIRRFHDGDFPVVLQNFYIRVFSPSSERFIDATHLKRWYIIESLLKYNFKMVRF